MTNVRRCGDYRCEIKVESDGLHDICMSEDMFDDLQSIKNNDGCPLIFKLEFADFCAFPNQKFRRQDHKVMFNIPFDMHVDDVLEIETNAPIDCYSYTDVQLYALNKPNPGINITLSSLYYQPRNNTIESSLSYVSKYTNRVVFSGSIVRYIQNVAFHDDLNVQLLTHSEQQHVYEASIERMNNKNMFSDLYKFTIRFNEIPPDNKTPLIIYGYSTA